MRGEQVLIVGATGNLGSRLIRRLAAVGVEPRVLVRTPEKAAQLAYLATPFIGDLLVPESLTEAFRGAERVFVLGQPTGDMERLERNAIDAALAAGAQRIVYMSNFTARVGSELRPNHIHGVHEGLVAASGTEWTVVGPTRYMTNFPFDWPSVLNDGVLLESGGTGVMTCIDPDDVAEIAANVLIEDGHDGQTYRMSSEDSFTAVELAVLLSEVTGRDVDVVRGVEPAGYFGLVADGLYFPTDIATKLLGRPPRTYREWLDEHGPALFERASPA